MQGTSSGLTPTIVSVADGPWSTPATWSPSRVPVAGDVVEIAKHTVDYDVAPVDLAGVIVEGTLRFTPSTSRELRSTGNVVVRGDLEMQPAAAAVQHTLTFVGVDEDAFVGSGMQVLDTDVGLWVEHMGRFVATGATKVPWTRVTGSVAAGAEAIVVEDATGWEVGDEIVIVPTLPPSLVPSDHSAWEGYDRSTIGSIAVSGPGTSRSIKLAHMTQHAHPEVDGKWRAEVLNLTRNVVVQGEPPTGTEEEPIFHRAHTMFLHTMNAQTVRNVEYRHMGPRKVQYGTSIPYTDELSDGIVGRYVVHFHHAGDGSRGSLVENVVVHDAGSRAFVPHASHGITLRGTVAHDTFDDAYWWDKRLSTETSTSQNDSHDILIEDAVASRVQANPNYRGFRLSGFDLGGGLGNTVVGSVAVGIVGGQDAAGYEWISGRGDSVWTFHDNIAHNNKFHGIFTWQNGHELHVVEDFVGYYNSVSGIDHGAYGNRYHYRDITLYGNEVSGVQVHAVSAPELFSPLTFENIVIDGAQLTEYGFDTRRHVRAVTTHTDTLFLDNTVRGLRAGGVAFAFTNTSTALEPGDFGSEATPNTTHRERAIIRGTDLTDIEESSWFYLNGWVDGGTAYGVLPESEVRFEGTDGRTTMLRSAHFLPTFAVDFTLPAWDPSDWPWYLVSQRVAGYTGAWSLEAGEGRFGRAEGPHGPYPASSTLASIAYMKTRESHDVDQSVVVRVTDAGARAGLVARRLDDDREAYYAATVGGAEPLTIWRVEDGVFSALASGTPMLTPNVDAELRFVVATDTSGATLLSARVWTGTEPTTWDVEITDVSERLEHRGRFGIFAEATPAGEVVFDDYVSTITDPVLFDADWNAYTQAWAAPGTPRVDAGRDRSLVLGGPSGAVAIDASVTDDGVVDPPTVDVAWSTMSGALVDFTGPASIDTVASFATAGVHHLRLAVNDGTHQSADAVTVRVVPSQPSSYAATFDTEHPTSWPAEWSTEVLEGAAATYDVTAGEARARATFANGTGEHTSLQYVTDLAAENVELLTSLRVSAGSAWGGVVLRRSDDDPDTFLAVELSAIRSELEVHQVVDGVRTSLAHVELDAPADQQRLRVRAETAADGTVALYVRSWDADGVTPEPSTWAIAIEGWRSPVFSGRAGRFGTLLHSKVSGRRLFVDDFVATLLDGVAPAGSTLSTFEEDWALPQGDPWGADWASEIVSGSAQIHVDQEEGYVRALSTHTRALNYVASAVASDVDLATDLRINANSGRGGLIVRRDDVDPDTYLGFRVGVTTHPNDRLRIFRVDDGVETDLWTETSDLFANVDYRVRLRTVEEGITTRLRVKVWPVGTPEPAVWRGEAVTTGAPSTGRFGTITDTTNANRRTWFDDLTATFYE